MKIRLIIILSLYLLGGTGLFAQEFESIRSSEILTENGQKFYMHQVVKGNTIYNISKTYGVAGNVILQHNPSLNDGLRLGMKLKIPYLEQKEEEFIYHIVKKKETLYQISKIYNVEIVDIRRLNKINGEEINPGQYLKIPCIYANTNSDLLNTSVESDVKTDKIDDEKYVIYKVQPKETLYNISKRFGISLDALMYLNDLESDRIGAGQVLLIPKNLVQQQSGASVDTAKFIQHKVRSKETLYGIARQYAVSIIVIEKHNELGEKQIQIGQILMIPRELNTTGFIDHKVSVRREKLTTIASVYNVSVTELKQANPRVSSKLKRGQSVLIPLGFVETDFEQTEELIEDTGEDQFDTSENEIAECERMYAQNKKFQVAFMFPMYLEEVDSLMFISTEDLMESTHLRPFKFIEFYEGALLAAQELYDAGLEFDFHIYDVPRDAESTAKLLLEPRLQDMDLIISLAYRKSFELISEFSKNRHIPLVNALSKRRKIIYENPNVFKVEPNESELYAKVSDYILNNYPNHNIILVRSNPYQLANEFQQMKQTLQLGIPVEISIPNDQILYKISSYEMEFLELPEYFAKTTTQELERDNPSFSYELIKTMPADTSIFKNNLKTVTYSIDSLAGMIEASSLFRDNLVVALGNEEVFAIELFTKLNFVRDSFNYEVIGLPYWHNYNSLDVAYSQSMRMHVMTSKFVDYSRPIVKNFVLNFRSEYGIEPKVNRHAFLGYDVTKYFLTALMDYGTDFPNCIEYMEVELLENPLKFKHIPDAAYENTSWNLIKQKNYNYQLVE